MLEWISTFDRKGKAFLVLFVFTCFQLATKIPYITVIPGERTNIFSGLLCGVTTIALLIRRRRSLRLGIEWTVCIVLSILCILSGVLSGDPPSSLWRGLTLILSSAGGFWCGRLFLSEPLRRILFARFVLVLLTLLVLLGVAGFFLKNNVLYFTALHKHEFNGMILLLSFGPVSLLYSGKRWMVIAGMLFLLLAAYAISLSFDPMIWFPPVLFICAVLLSSSSLKRWLLVLCLVFVVFVALFQKHKLPDYFFEKDSISIWVRVENVFFSYHMAKKKPLLGIGLVAPRLAYLEDYSIVYPYITMEKFSAVLPEDNRSSENQFMTFMCDLGFPFLFIYVFSLVFLYLKLLESIRRHGLKGEQNSMILWVPITGALLHFQFFDGLLHPQIAWFFHLYLGMIPLKKAELGEGIFPERARELAGSSPVNESSGRLKSSEGT